MVANGLQEMVLFGQIGGTTLRPANATLIKIFPAVPRAWESAVFSKLRTEGAFVVSARLAGGQVEVFTITATSARVDVEIHARLPGDTLCVVDAHGGSTLTMTKNGKGARPMFAVVTGRLVRGSTVVVHSAATASACHIGSNTRNTTEPLPGDPTAYNHYGYKP